MDTKFSFEKAFSDRIGEMVGACYEYIDGRAEKIYLYMTDDAYVAHANCFFKINGRHAMRGCLNSALRPGEPPYDESGEAQRWINKEITMTWNDLRDEFKCNKRPVPKEIRVTYDVATGESDIQVDYETDWAKERISGRCSTALVFAGGLCRWRTV